MSARGLTQLRTAARMAVREHASILLLVHRVPRELRLDIEKAQENIARENNRARLRKLVNDAAAEISNLRGQFGFKASRDVLLDTLDNAEHIPPGHGTFIAKFRIEQLMSGYDKVSADYRKLPPHALFDYGQLKDVPSFEVRILEASLFEDMCALFNDAHELNSRRPASPYGNKLTTKRCDAINRATATAAFYFVEAYLNGIAFDHLIVNGSKMVPKERDMLTEWSSEKQRRRAVTFRDKLLHYPRIICRMTHPPLPENNCPEVRFLLETAKVLRDAIVHASARPEQEYGMNKWLRYTNLNFFEVREIVDNPVNLVLRIEKTIHGNTDGISWLQRRTSEGLFAGSVFN